MENRNEEESKNLASCIKEVTQKATEHRAKREEHFSKKRQHLFDKLKKVGVTQYSKFPIGQTLSPYKVGGNASRRARRARVLTAVSEEEGKKDYYYHEEYLDENQELLTHDMKDFKKEMEHIYKGVHTCYKKHVQKYETDKQCVSTAQEEFNKKTQIFARIQEMQHKGFYCWWSGKKQIIEKNGGSLGGQSLAKWDKEVYHEINGEFKKYWHALNEYRHEWLKSKLFLCNKPVSNSKDNSLKILRSRDM